MKFDRKTFFDAMRNAFSIRLRQQQVDGAEEFLASIEADDELGQQFDVAVKLAAYLLATAWHETAYTLKPIAEYGLELYFDRYDPVRADTEKRRDRAKRMGNTEEGDGFRYRGRGYVQMTWKSNYKRASEELGVDFVGNPDLALDPAYAYRLLSGGLMRGWYTGKRLGDYINEHVCNYVTARKCVNGTDHAGRIAWYATAFERCLLESSTSEEKS